MHLLCLPGIDEELEHAVGEDGHYVPAPTAEYQKEHQDLLLAFGVDNVLFCAVDIDFAKVRA
jgi:hypothetical protein